MSKGHPSSDPDYCSECGVRIGVTNAPSLAPLSVSPITMASAPASHSGATCPDCGTANGNHSRFCEVCRYDFYSGGNAASAGVGVAMPLPVVPAPTQSAPIFIMLASRLNMAIVIDPALAQASGVSLPAPADRIERIFPLDLDENLVGRRSDSRGIYPEIEVRDPGVSHRHLKLIKQADSSFVALELGSANGSLLNGVTLVSGVPMPVTAGDEFTLGVWTRLILRERK